MPSKTVFRATAEAARNGFYGLFDLTVGRNASASHSDRFLGFKDTYTLGGTVYTPNPQSIFAIMAGNNSEDRFAMRNSVELRPTTDFLLCGSGSAGTEHRVTGRYDVINRTNQGELTLPICGGFVGPSGFAYPTKSTTSA